MRACVCVSVCARARAHIYKERAVGGGGWDRSKTKMKKMRRFISVAYTVGVVNSNSMTVTAEAPESLCSGVCIVYANYTKQRVAIGDACAA